MCVKKKILPFSYIIEELELNNVIEHFQRFIFITKQLLTSWEIYLFIYLEACLVFMYLFFDLYSFLINAAT